MRKQQSSKKYNLQIPVDIGLVQDVERKAKDMGFDSLQAFTRFVYTSFNNNKLNIGVLTEDRETLSPEEESYYTNMIKEHERERSKGKVKTFTDVDDMIEDLLRDD